MYTCTQGYDSQLPAPVSANETRSYNELATLMYVTGGLLCSTQLSSAQVHSAQLDLARLYSAILILFMRMKFRCHTW